jgi:molybdopterin converting factor small subunit
MNIEVKLFYDLAQYLPPEAKNSKGHITLEEGATIQNLLDKLYLPELMLKTVLVNGVRPKNETELQEGDVIAIFPPLAGG